MLTRMMLPLWMVSRSYGEEPDCDAVFDLKNGNITNFSDYITVFKELTGSGCETQGVIKVTLASASDDKNRRRVLFILFFSDPDKWVFNVGDSARNNGWGGDDGHQSRDAEVQGIGNNFAGYLSQEADNEPAFNLVNLYSFNLSLLISDGQAVWLAGSNINTLNFYNDRAFLPLNGQRDDTGPENYDLYLAMNRVVSTSRRSGTGLCKVCIKFLSKPECTGCW